MTDFTTRGLQFHFHYPAEHTVDSKEYALELHIVHKLMYVRPHQQELFKKWKYAVTGVFMDVPSNLNSLNDQQK